MGGAAAEGAGTAAAAAFPIAEGLGMAAGVATGGVAALAGGRRLWAVSRRALVAIRQRRRRGLELRRRVPRPANAEQHAAGHAAGALQRAAAASAAAHGLALEQQRGRRAHGSAAGTA